MRRLVMVTLAGVLLEAGKSSTRRVDMVFCLPDVTLPVPCICRFLRVTHRADAVSSDRAVSSPGFDIMRRDPHVAGPNNSLISVKDSSAPMS